jgi:outer membrane protein assembly factor BamB
VKSEEFMRRLSSLLLLLLCAVAGHAGDWPQWLGPSRDASSPEPVSPWKEAPRVVWRHKVGEGNSSPIVANGRVFVLARPADKDDEEMLALDAEKGAVLWQKSYQRASFKSLYGNGPRATPAASDGKVYSFGITGVLTCFDAEKGTILWQVDTLKEFHAKNLYFGMACSPLVHGDGVLVNIGAAGASLVAFDRNKGSVLWKSQDDRASYSSPIGFRQADREQAVFLTQQGVVSLNPSEGHLFWRFPLVDQLLESSTTPVRAGDVLMASSITYGSVGLKLEAKGGRPAATQLWKKDGLTCYFSTPVAVGTDYLYVVTGTKPPALFNQADLHCIEAQTGKELWRKPKVGTYHASLLRTGNNKLLMLEEPGNLVLLDPNPKLYRELARSKVCGETWAHPALADGKLYVRDNREVICLELEPAPGR